MVTHRPAGNTTGRVGHQLLQLGERDQRSGERDPADQDGERGGRQIGGGSVLDSLAGPRNSTDATSAAAPPPTPLNSATSCGIAVIRTCRAVGRPIAVPTTIAPMISPGASGVAWSGRRSPPGVAPQDPISVPMRAVRGADRPLRVRMKQIPAIK